MKPVFNIAANELIRLTGRKSVDSPWAFPLAPGPHLFTDWRYVLAGEVWGGFRWLDPHNGKTIKGNGINRAAEYPDDQLIDAVLDLGDVPHGISIETNPGSLGMVNAPSGNTFDLFTLGAHVLMDGGCLRTWWHSPKSKGQFSPKFEHSIYCAESDNGFDWHNRQVCSFDWSKCRDIQAWEAPGGFFIDPQAPAKERYKMVFQAKIARNEHSQWREQLLQRWLSDPARTVDPVSLRSDKKQSVPIIEFARCGAVSSDGVHWQVLPEPLMIHHSDAQNVISYDPLRESYVWYLKSERHGNRRCVARAETKDFRHWPTPEPILVPELAQGPACDWYTSSKTIYPGTIDHHLMFPALYRHNSDDSELRLYSSQEGIAWSAVPGQAVFTADAAGAGDCGFIVGGVNLVHIGNEHVGLPISVAALPHKYPRNSYTRSTWSAAYALWPRERLAALTALEYGSFATVPLLLKKRRLRLNARVKRSGDLRVEVVTSNKQGGGAKVLPGYSFNDCCPVIGDRPDHIVTWHNGNEINYAPGQALTLRFRLRAAELFAFEIF